MAETTVNVPLLTKVLEHVTAHPREHIQRQWAVRSDCGTAYCLAGHALVMSGVQMRWEAIDDEELAESLDAQFRADLTTDGKWIDAEAMCVLGLNAHQANALFAPWNNLDDLWELAEWITGGEIRRPG